MYNCMSFKISLDLPTDTFDPRNRSVRGVCVYWHCSLAFYWFFVRNSSLCSFHCINTHCCNFVLNLILKSVMFGTTVCEMC